MVVTAYPVSHRDPHPFSAVPAKALGHAHLLRLFSYLTSLCPRKRASRVSDAMTGARALGPRFRGDGGISIGMTALLEMCVGTQGHTLRSSRLRLLGQGKTLNAASRCDLHSPWRESGGDEKYISSFPRQRESIRRRTIAIAEVDWRARSPACEVEGKL
jgi:hypothetical protein